MLRKLKELIRKEILILLRDRQTIPILFIMPAALIFFLSLAMQGIYTEKVTGQKISVVIETAGHSPKSLLLMNKISAHKLIQRVERPQGFNNDKLFENGKAHAVIYIPEGFENGTRQVEMEFDPVLDAGYKAAARSLITGLTASVVMGIDDMEAMAASFIVEKTKKNKNLPSPLQQSVPGWAIFAMFFIAIPMSIGFLREKNDGTLQRLFTYPVGSDLIIFGKLIPYYLINVIQFVLMLVVGIYIMPLVIKIPFALGAHPWHLIPVKIGRASCRERVS
jgi:ABC-2 type transport system permease protein